MIHVIGDIIIDEYWHGDSSRLSPEAPVPIVNLKKKQISLGGAANVYNNIRGLTDRVTLFGLYEKRFGEHFPDKRFLVETDKMPVKIRVMSGSHYVTRIDDEVHMDNIALYEAFVNHKFEKNDIIFISDYNKGTIQPESFIGLANRRGIRTIVDPKVDLGFYHGSWLLKPNRKEFESYCGSTSSIDELTRYAKDFKHTYGITHLVVTLSEDGVLYVGDNGSFHLPTLVNQVSDVTGAGDTFGAVMAYWISKDCSMKEALQKANAAAAQAVQYSGTYVYEE